MRCGIPARLFLLLGLWGCGIVPACGQEETRDALPAPHALSDGEGEAGPSPRRLSAPGAFDLITTARGALLVHADPGGVLFAQSLDPRGVPRGPPVRVARATTRVLEVGATARAGRVGLAWTAATGEDGDGEVVGALGRVDGLSFGPPERLGETRILSAVRGALALATSDEGVVDVFFRAGFGPCSVGGVVEACIELRHQRLGGDAGARRRGLPLVVREPCARPVVGNVYLGSQWYFALCSLEDGVPLTTVYALEFEPEYARAEPVLRGCQPLSLTPLPDAVLILGVCDHGREAVRLSEAARTRIDLGAPEPQLSCVDGRPRLSLGPAGVTLADPTAHLGPLLDRGGSDGRAVLAGEALVIARVRGGTLSVTRHLCHGKTLVAVPGKNL